MPTYQSSKRVRCPGCSSILEVPNKRNQPQFTFKCPKCGRPLLVKFHEVEENQPQRPRQPEPEEAHTVMQRVRQPDTNLPPKDKWPSTPGTLLWGTEYATLHEGKNTCGRRPSRSQPLAQVHFPVGVSVSKLHFDINVKRRKNGTYLVTLSLHKDRVSQTLVDNLPLRFGDEVLLRDGSVIIAGYERFIYTSRQ